MKNRLFIIGNGFDLKHRLPSSYDQFGQFCLNHYPEVYTTMQSLFSVPADALWADFENSLGKLNQEKLKREYQRALKNGDLRNNYVIQRFQIDLAEAFKEWIVSLKRLTPELKPCFVFDDTDAFISFNYTDLLETLYHIKKRKLHVHGYAQSGIETELFAGYIYGHGKEEVKTMEPIDSWEDTQCFFVNGLRKNYQLEEIKGFLNGHITDYPNIIVWGHSMSSIDDCYFMEIRKIYEQSNIVPEWFIYYYDEKDLDKKMAAISRLQIINHHLIKM